jgi:hypothetical protein
MCLGLSCRRGCRAALAAADIAAGLGVAPRASSALRAVRGMPPSLRADRGGLRPLWLFRNTALGDEGDERSESPPRAAVVRPMTESGDAKNTLLELSVDMRDADLSGPATASGGIVRRSCSAAELRIAMTPRCATAGPRASAPTDGVISGECVDASAGTTSEPRLVESRPDREEAGKRPDRSTSSLPAVPLCIRGLASELLHRRLIAAVVANKGNWSPPPITLAVLADVRERDDIMRDDSMSSGDSALKPEPSAAEVGATWLPRGLDGGAAAGDADAAAAAATVRSQPPGTTPVSRNSFASHAPAESARARAACEAILPVRLRRRSSSSASSAAADGEAAAGAGCVGDCTFWGSLFNGS